MVNTERAWEIARPYMVSLIAHFVILCLTMVALVLMLTISWWVISFSENALNVDSLAVKFLVYVSDLLILAHFMRMIVRSWNFTKQKAES